MSWNYEDKIKEYIAQAVNDSGVGSDFTFEVCTEQAFVKIKKLDPNTVYVVIKYLSSTNTLNAITQPIQLIVSCEQNQIQVSQIVFSKLVVTHNFEAIIDSGTYIKQDYREPVVLSNFNDTSYGYRTIMYISATLFIMEDVTDISVTVDGVTHDNSFSITTGTSAVPITEVVRPISFNMAYSMTPNTQQKSSEHISSSVKSVSTFSVSFVVPFTSNYNFLEKISNIMSGSVSGNLTFTVKFSLNDVSFDVPMKLVSCQMNTAINQVPGVQIGLIK